MYQQSLYLILDPLHAYGLLVLSPCRARHGHNDSGSLAERLYVTKVDDFVVRVEYGRTADLLKK